MGLSPVFLSYLTIQPTWTSNDEHVKCSFKPLNRENIPYANTTVIILLSCVKCREGKFPCPLILTQCLLNVPLRGVIIRFPRKETFVVRQER